MPAGWSGPPQHVHRAHDETFFVLSGRVRFTTGAESHVLGAGGMFAAGSVPRTRSATPMRTSPQRCC